MKPSAEAESPDELMDRVCALTDSERRYALNWLAAAGGGAPDGQAVLRALAAVSLYRERLAAVSRVRGAGA